MSESLSSCPGHVHDGPPRPPVDLMHECVYVLNMFESFFMASHITLCISAFSRAQLFATLASRQMRADRDDTLIPGTVVECNPDSAVVQERTLFTTPEPIVSQIQQSKPVSIVRL